MNGKTLFVCVVAAVSLTHCTGKSGDGNKVSSYVDETYKGTLAASLDDVLSDVSLPTDFSAAQPSALFETCGDEKSLNKAIKSLTRQVESLQTGPSARLRASMESCEGGDVCHSISQADWEIVGAAGQDIAGLRRALAGFETGVDLEEWSAFLTNAEPELDELLGDWVRSHDSADVPVDLSKQVEVLTSLVALSEFFDQEARRLSYLGWVPAEASAEAYTSLGLASDRLLQLTQGLETQALDTGVYVDGVSDLAKAIKAALLQSHAVTASQSLALEICTEDRVWPILEATARLAAEVERFDACLDEGVCRFEALSQ